MWPIPQFPADLVTFTEEILNGNLHFLYSAINFFVVEEETNVVPTPIPTKPPKVEAKPYVPRQIYGGLYICL